MSCGSSQIPSQITLPYPRTAAPPSIHFSLQIPISCLTPYSHYQWIALILIQRKGSHQDLFFSASFCITFRFNHCSTCSYLFLSALNEKITILCKVILSWELWISFPIVFWVNCTPLSTFSPSVSHKLPVPCLQPIKTKQRQNPPNKPKNLTASPSLLISLSSFLSHLRHRGIVEVNRF